MSEGNGIPVPTPRPETFFQYECDQAGVDPVVMMKLTGHKTFEMFSRYSHLDQEQVEIAVEKLNGLLGQKSGEKEHADSK